MNLAETAVLAVQLKLEDQLSGGVARAEGELAGLNATTKASGTNLTSLAGAANVARGGVVRFGGALGHAKSQLVSLATGPLGLIGLGAGLFSLGGLFEKSVGKAQDFGMEVSKLAKLTGLSVETTSALAAALEHFGVSSDGALRSLGFLEKNVGLLASQKNGIVDFEKSFGLALTDANGHLKDANALVLASADYFNNKSIPATTKAAALAKLYGRSWQQLIPFLSAGSKGIRDAEAAAASLGLTLTKTNVQDLAKFKESTRELGTAIGGLELQIGLALVPAMKDLADAATSFVRDNRAGIVSFFKQAISVGRDFAGFVTHSLLPAFKQVAGAAISFWDAIPGPLKDLLVKGYVTNRVVKFLFGVDVVGDIAGALGKGIERALGNAVGNGLVQAGLGKLFVQPVFVTNPGFGGGLPNLLPEAGAAAGAGEAGAAAAGLGIGTITIGLAAGTAIAALGIMGLGWLINATSSKASQAVTAQNVIDQNRLKRTGGGVFGADPTPALTRLGDDFRGGVNQETRSMASLGDDFKSATQRLPTAIALAGRPWQREQISEARKVVSSTKNATQRIAELKTIQSHLLAHQRSAAAKQVAQMIALINAVRHIPGPLGVILPGDSRSEGRSMGPGTANPGPSIRNGFVVNANVAVSTRDVNTAQNVKRRYGPTPTQAGAW